MNKKVTIINGSLRVMGNTDELLKELLNGTTGTDIIIKEYKIRDKRIEGCKGCYDCHNNGKCSINDDMQEIHGELQSSNLLIFASPMYWMGVTGLMKTFIDRLYFYCSKRNAELISGKKLIILTPMHINETEHGEKLREQGIKPLIITSEFISSRLGIDIIDIIFFEGLNIKGDAIISVEYLKRVFELGEQLVHL